MIFARRSRRHGRGSIRGPAGLLGDQDPGGRGGDGAQCRGRIAHGSAEQYVGDAHLAAATPRCSAP